MPGFLLPSSAHSPRVVWVALSHRALIFLVNRVFLTTKPHHKMLRYLDYKHSNSSVLTPFPFFLLTRTNNLALKDFFFYNVVITLQNRFLTALTATLEHFSSQHWSLSQPLPQLHNLHLSTSTVDSTMTWGKVNCKNLQNL